MLMFNEFCNIVQTRILEYLPEKYMYADVQLHVADKLNGTQKIGIVIRENDEKMNAAVYLEEFFEQYQQGTSMNDICEVMAKVYEQSLEKGPDIRRVDLANYEQIKDKITMKLVNYKDNRKMLLDIPYKKIDDLAVIYKIDLPLKDKSLGQASATIRNEHMEMYGITEKELHAVAFENTRNLNPPELMNLSVAEVLYADSENLLESGVQGESGNMYVLTNQERGFGATSVLYPDVMERTKEIVGEDFYILPSSLHEVILVPKSVYDAKFLGDMVREINANEVSRDEVLSDHVYEYDFKEKEIQTVKESLVREREMER